MNYFALPGLRKHYVGDLLPTAVINCVCKHLKVDKGRVIRKGRKREVVHARFMIFYILRTYTRMSLKEVGDIFGRDHSTVIHGVSTFKDRYDTEDDTKADLVTIVSKLDLEKPTVSLM